MLKRALISVYYKENLKELALFLQSMGVEIISTGKTYQYLKDNGIQVKSISSFTGFEEILDGRVKTLHPKVHGGILAIRDKQEHMQELQSMDIKTIDMVVVNLYPFFEKAVQDISFEDKIEFIDIGGPSMLRSAAKNFKDVIVLSDTTDYSVVIEQLKNNGDVEQKIRRELAAKAFNLTSAYDAAISSFLTGKEFPEYLSLSYTLKQKLRYGENPHQKSVLYARTDKKGLINNCEQISGKELSYNNIRDMDVAYKLVTEFDEPACCAVKHNSPCGAAVAQNIYDAYTQVYECDPVSIFGGIVAFNRPVDLKTAEKLHEIFLEIIIAPDFEPEALLLLKSKKNLRIIKCDCTISDKLEMITVDGGVLVQSIDRDFKEEYKVVTKTSPTQEQLRQMKFGMIVAKYTKSNAIVTVKQMHTASIAGGQVNRIWPAVQAMQRGKGAQLLCSDAFFPFDDIVQAAYEYGIKAIMQPGGSVNDKASIELCDKYGISMVFTGIRHFKH
ncbi:MAG TPA: bifunctional phosphoribosylaminoimidazolecarboxamide formyltransferase/IMP cyclohydrolase [Petrotogaceae bacterium]|jgi:phosphoribosylaminoimidazolecarboxamide formyltransferase/IMP cyclohydrolase|nr:bifunctional phosphoribosylaminoimidazolecarboxamide formyltransferase/IMP cyclohydrolase [Petrotogaceae bacterium]HQP57433.1 bifunctional phosphoribosylaminoimidazolecarboxamide formyltransferase/IMP cyclohydrolase [Petrotogaceae bacterium]